MITIQNIEREHKDRITKWLSKGNRQWLESEKTRIEATTKKKCVVVSLEDKCLALYYDTK